MRSWRTRATTPTSSTVKTISVPSQPGKLADMFIADRDYLTVPADDIRLIKSVMTIVGGRVVYDAAAENATR